METIVKDKNKRIITERDVEIVRLLSRGTTARQAALELSMNTRTFESKIYRLKLNFDANTIAHLVAIFIRQKLID